MAYSINHVTVPNIAPVSQTQFFNQMWSLTRGLKKAGWKSLSGSDGVTKTLSADPELDPWNGTPVATNAGGTASLTIAAPVNASRSQISGLSGIVASDKGRFLRISGAGNAANNHWHQIEEVVNATTVKVDSRTFTLVAETASMTWSIVDPTLETYSSIAANVVTNSCWWLARGPSMIRIPITAAPTVGSTGAPMLRGENVVQTTTGAEGELVGFEFNGTSAGFLVIRPRVRGSGANPYGWGSGNVITGSSSGATVTQNGTGIEYRHEIVIWKANNESTGTLYMTFSDPVGESGLFSGLTGSAGCTATVAPGGGGTGNAFPSLGWIIHGTNTSGTHAAWDLISASRNLGNAHAMCADAIEEPSWSADGSFWYVSCSVGNIAAGGCSVFGFQILDESEPGDLHPYVSFSRTSSTLYSNTRITTIGAYENGGSVSEVSSYWITANVTSMAIWSGWRRRGLSTFFPGAADQYQDFEGGYAATSQSGSGNFVGAFNLPDANRLATALVPTKVRQPVALWSIQSNRKMMKGQLRWGFIVQSTGGWGDLHDNKRFIQGAQPVAGVVAIIIGPWDGVTTPRFQEV